MSYSTNSKKYLFGILNPFALLRILKVNKNLTYTSIFLIGIITFSYFFPLLQEEKNDKYTVMSTTVIIDSVVREIVKDTCNTTVLMEGEADPHSYQMRKGDREKIYAADLILANGLSLEHNPSLYHHLVNEKAVFLGDILLEKEPSLIIANDGEVDPHIWMDLSIMQKIADEICHTLSKRDPGNAPEYAKNTNELKERMQALDQKIIVWMKEIPEENRYLVSSHDAFNYYVRRYFISDTQKRLFSMQGISTESEISLKRIRQVINYIKEHRISTIFFESNLPKDCILKVLEICATSHLDVAISSDPLYGDTLGGMTYLQMIEHDAKVIAKNLRSKESK